ncbi:MAG: glycosyltransferase family 2 protein [Ruminococcaceae bacterium]|nr:glycosyltransferase family 2 protein [Oscillospiraceae bacterium]
MANKLLSIIVPCYSEEEALPAFWEEITKVTDLMSNIDFEFIFIDDGSKDNTKLILRDMAKADSRVRYVSFSRNFGKEAAMYAGLKYSKGDYVAIMDADLQDPPALLPEMLKAIEEEGYDSVATRRVTRKGEPKIRSWFARRFYQVMRMMCKTEVVDGARDYRLMKRRMVDSILEMGEYNRFFKGILGWVGFNTKWIEFENVERVKGETKWSFWKLFKYSLEGITAFTTAPLALASIIGLLFCIISFLAIIFVIVRQLIWGGSAYGWPSMICIILMLSGIQLFTIGIVGQYLAKTYLEVKKRPIYIVGETEEDL